MNWHECNDYYDLKKEHCFCKEASIPLQKITVREMEEVLPYQVTL